MSKPLITDVVFDFDGTCTQVPAIFEAYLEKYYSCLADYLNNTMGAYQKLDEPRWQAALANVKGNSPKRGWVVAANPQSAPAGADPFIMAGEAQTDILKAHNNMAAPPTSCHAVAYNAFPAPFRAELYDVFTELMNRDVKIHVISNSSTDTITQRFTYLFLDKAAGIGFYGNASKFAQKKPQTTPESAWGPFNKLPAKYESSALSGLGRDVFLDRGAYFDAIYQALGGLSRISTTIFCGDIWELDLAMPYKLGGNIHLIERAAPFNTYPYEKQVVDECGERGKISADLTGLMAWF
jgi:phosphoglycolate phosphatase-like HAD superfamily hydrolase